MSAVELFFVFPLVLAYGLACFFLGYTTPRETKTKTNEEHPAMTFTKPADHPELTVVSTESDSFTRPEEPRA